MGALRIWMLVIGGVLLLWFTPLIVQSARLLVAVYSPPTQCSRVKTMHFENYSKANYKKRLQLLNAASGFARLRNDNEVKIDAVVAEVTEIKTNFGNKIVIKYQEREYHSPTVVDIGQKSWLQMPFIEVMIGGKAVTKPIVLICKDLKYVELS